MALAPYKQLALRWQPKQAGDQLFLVIAALSVVVMLSIGVILSKMQASVADPRVNKPVPARIAKFITQRPPKPEAQPPQTKVKPKPKLKPKLKPKPEKKPDKPKLVPTRKSVRPATDTQQKARDKAAKSGLLSHLSELTDLMDTATVTAQIQGSVNKNREATKSAGLEAKILTAGVAEGSGGVNADKYAVKTGVSQLANADITAANAALGAEDQGFAGSRSRAQRAMARSQEEITLVMDRHKGQLQSLYNRARRKNPTLKGKLVLAITVLPSGSVQSVRVVSSELNQGALEARVKARVKAFKFGAKDVTTVTVTYPIEFLP